MKSNKRKFLSGVSVAVAGLIGGSVAIASSSSSTSNDIPNLQIDVPNDTLLIKPAESASDAQFTGHRSHYSHRSHSSHRSHYSSYPRSN